MDIENADVQPTGQAQDVPSPSATPVAPSTPASQDEPVGVGDARPDTGPLAPLGVDDAITGDAPDAPREEIGTGSAAQGPDAPSFEDLLAQDGGGPVALHADDAFGRLQVAEFHTQTRPPPNEGMHELNLENAALHRLLALTGLSVTDSGSDSPFDWVELTASQIELAGRSYDRSSFSVCIVPLLGSCPTLAGKARLTLVVSHGALVRALRAAGTVIRLVFDARANSLTFQSDRFARPLALKPAKRFVAPDASNLGPDLDRSPVTVPTQAIARALAFVAPFLPQGDVDPAFRSLTVADGVARGGGEGVIAHCADPAFAGWDLRVDRAHIERLKRALPALGEAAQRTETAHYVRFAGQDTVFGVAQPGAPFPAYDAALPAGTRDLAANRTELIHRLRGLATAHTALIRLRVPRSRGSRVRAVLAAAASADAPQSKTSVLLQWRSLDQRAFGCSLPLLPVLRALEVLEGTYVDLRFSGCMQRLVVHSGDEGGPATLRAVFVALPRSNRHAGDTRGRGEPGGER